MDLIKLDIRQKSFLLALLITKAEADIKSYKDYKTQNIEVANIFKRDALTAFKLYKQIRNGG